MSGLPVPFTANWQSVLYRCSMLTFTANKTKMGWNKLTQIVGFVQVLYFLALC